MCWLYNYWMVLFLMSSPTFWGGFMCVLWVTIIRLRFENEKYFFFYINLILQVFISSLVECNSFITLFFSSTWSFIYYLTLSLLCCMEILQPNENHLACCKCKNIYHRPMKNSQKNNWMILRNLKDLMFNEKFQN